MGIIMILLVIAMIILGLMTNIAMTIVFAVGVGLACWMTYRNMPSHLNLKSGSKYYPVVPPYKKDTDEQNLQD